MLRQLPPLYTQVGTVGNDVATGEPNEGNTFWNYGIGHDIVTGGNENDTFTLIVDPLIDVIDGGAGRDLADFSDNSAGLLVDLSNSIVRLWEPAYEASGFSILTNFEDVIGTQFSDVIVGNDADNTFEGGAGGDHLNGGRGVDTASYAHSASGVTVTLDGLGYGGDAEGDLLFSIENLIGSDYDDVFYGNGASNIINGGAGMDRVTYANATDGVNIDYSNPVITVRGDSPLGPVDQLVNIELVEGSHFDDTYHASTRADTFVFGKYVGSDGTVYGVGEDTIEGFDAAGTIHDVIRLEGWFTNWNDLRDHMRDTGDDVEIYLDDQNSITLTNVRYNDLDSSDFYLV